MLAENEEWEYFVPDIPDSHWIERGFDNCRVTSKQFLRVDVKERTCKMRFGKMEDSSCVIEGKSMVPNDDLLLPH